MCKDGCSSAFLNVKINCGDCDDKLFVDDIIKKGEKLVQKACTLEDEILKIYKF